MQSVRMVAFEGESIRQFMKGDSHEYRCGPEGVYSLRGFIAASPDYLDSVLRAALDPALASLTRVRAGLETNPWHSQQPSD